MSPYPSELGFVMPAEWSPQEAVWLSWPVADPRHWGGTKQQRIEGIFANLAATLSRYETVRINVNPGEIDTVRQGCLSAGADPDRLELFDHEHNDVWCRDHGPIFLKHRESGEVAIADWMFNAWGGKFPPWDADNTIPEKIADSLSLRRFPSRIILEGGAIEVNGNGQLLTTEAVLLNPNRNPAMSRGEIETELKRMLGIHQVLWLKEGIEGDDTDGHIDDLVRFTGPDTLVAAVDATGTPNGRILEENLRCLKTFRSASGSPFELVEIPLPEACEVPGWRLPVLPASYVNFLILNDGVVVPTFRQPRNDDRALGMLRELFPGREVVGFDALELVEEGGTIHCLTQQQPA
ncbi:agmatine deiminase family protein [Haloferula rosea]|uniref:Agmatine deiminase family protein n=1 Tax=Haloferula rosea TaxID=490093 RepID=A0A934VFY6_9BACT|nr:agmatine deiminase family protein [Haloferula rosea]MBK1827536.1 agmatine deiminase family protein [Haloferula rosea]